MTGLGVLATIGLATVAAMLQPADVARALEVAGLGAVDPAGLLDAVGDLEGAVAVGLRGLHLHDPQGRDAHDRDRDDAVLVVPDLGHADLLADKCLGGHVVPVCSEPGGPARGGPGSRG